MKVWKKAQFLKKDKKVEELCRSYINYIYKDGPIDYINAKYNIEENDLKILNEHFANRMAGLILLYLAKDKKRLNDIALKYQSTKLLVPEIIPEIEGYIEK